MSMKRALLCETVTGRTMGELIAARDAATSADIVELRLDGVSRCDVARALDGRARPAIVTCRPVWEGGQFDGAEEERCELLGDALSRGAEYVDIEWRALSVGGGRGCLDELVGAHGARVVVSSHDFDRVPDDLGARAAAMRATGAAVIKVAVSAHRLCDTLPLMELAKGREDAVVIGMGDAGVPTRLLATRFGSRWTYAGNAVTPGQIPANRMLSDYRFRDIGPRTALYGFVSSNGLSSGMPAVLNGAFSAAGMDAVCVPLAGEDDADVRAFSDALRFAGVMKDIDAHHHV
jgi:3-dehydroquinate dehydratase type I